MFTPTSYVSEKYNNIKPLWHSTPAIANDIYGDIFFKRAAVRGPAIR
jgi:hypothetical protein